MVEMQAVELTERQDQVAEGLARHLAIKEIAAELDISMSAVSKHIANLKVAFDATTHAEIVAAWAAQRSDIIELSGVEKVPWHFSHLSHSAPTGAQGLANDPGSLRFGDGADYPLNWPGNRELRVVPRWLDGSHATAARLAVIGGGIFGLVAVLVLTLSAMSSLSELVVDTGPNLVLENRSAE